MNKQKKGRISDDELITLLINDNISAWNCIYDKYAPVMYGNILNLTADKVLAEGIFIKAFINLIEKNNSFPQHCTMKVFLSSYAKNFTSFYLNNEITQ